jgi:hypothetical protein
MRFDHTVEFEADIDTVAAMLADRDFTSRRVEAAGATSHDLTIAPADDGGFDTEVDATIPTTIIPASYRGLVGESFRVRIDERWSGPGPAGARDANFTLNVGGLPVRVVGTQSLRAAGGVTALNYSGDVTCSIPLVGKKVESAVAGAVDTVLEAERRVGIAYLAARRAGDGADGPRAD